MLASLVASLLSQGLASHVKTWSCSDVKVEYKDAYTFLCPANTYLNGILHDDTRSDGKTTCGIFDGSGQCLSSIKQARCCTMDQATTNPPSPSLVDRPTDFDFGETTACPAAYFMLGFYMKSKSESLDGWESIKCYRPIGPSTPTPAPTEVSLPINYIIPPSNGSWLKCPDYQYVTGLKSANWNYFLNREPGDIFDMTLYCAPPADASCGGAPAARNVTLLGSLTCTHQRCTVSQVCSPGYQAVSGTSGSNLTCLGGTDFQWTGVPLTCQDVNECNTPCPTPLSSNGLANGCHNCSTTQGICTNTYGELGGFTCSCNPGFRGDGRNCTDISECLRPCNTLAGENPTQFACHNCSQNANCIEQAPWFSCTCKPGYGSFPTCSDINECDRNCSGSVTTDCNKCDLHAACRNTDGGYSCNCAPGWSGNGTTCVDIDECQYPACTGSNAPCYQCPFGAKCSNLPNGGFYECVCASGFAPGEGGCVNINECLNASTCPNAACVDTTPGFVCGPRFSFITIDGTTLSSNAIALISSFQSPSQTVVFSIQSVTSPFTWTGTFFFGDALNPLRYQTGACTPGGPGSYTCPMTAGAGRNLFFSLQYTTNFTGATIFTFSDTAKLFSFPLPTLTPGTLRRVAPSPGAYSLAIPLTFATIPVVWMNGTNLPTNKLDLAVAYGDGVTMYPCVVQSSIPAMLSCAVSPIVGEGMVFTLIVGHGNQSWQVQGSDTLNLTVAGPSIIGLAGCKKDTNTVIKDCPTDGKTSLKVTLDVDITSSVLMLIGGSACLDPKVTSNRTFNCTLPPGAGTGILVTVALGDVFSPAQPLLSYIRPTILGIMGESCKNSGSYNHISECPLNPASGNQLWVAGNDFGPNPSIFVGSRRYPATLRTCIPPAPPTGVTCIGIPLPPYTSALGSHEQPIYVLQENGQVSTTKLTLEYKAMCGKGKYEDNNTCVNCPAGRFSDVQGALCITACIPCAPGSYQVNPGSSVCDLCIKGFYQPAEGTSACKECPAGTFSNLFGEVQCTPCSAGSYSDLPKQTTCISCDVGHAQPNSNQTSCEECGGGYYADNIGQVVCKTCGPGYFNAFNGSNGCSPCLPGTFYKGSTALQCDNCLAGSYSNAQAWSVDCQLCVPGRFLNTSMQNTECLPCEPGRAQASSGSSNCTSCGGGYYSPSGASKCYECIAGTFSSGGSTCFPCSPGFYQDQPGSQNCSACPPGSWNRDPGSSSCFKCEIGDYSNITNATRCTPCPSGSFSDEEGALACLECDVGYYQPSTGQTACLDCPPGRIGDTAGEDDCHDCDPGSYSSISNSLECTNCTKGTYQYGAGQSSCFPCDLGKYTGLSSQITCDDCPAGKRSATPLGSSGCVDCEYGTVSNVGGTTSCSACVPGKFSNTTGRTVCVDCEIGFYLSNSSLQTCLPCPLGSFADSTGSSICQGCPIGKFSTQGGSSALSLECDPCPAGSFAASVGSTVCKNCSVGNFSSSEGHSECLPCPTNQVAGKEGSKICTRCPLGSFSNTARSACLCIIGYYGVVDSSGNMYCEKCTIEMVCKVAGLGDFEVPTAPGWWRPNDDFKYLRCPNEQFCMGGTGNQNLCLPHHHGPLCGLCDPGYQAAAGGPCKACDSKDSNLAQASLVLIAMAILAIIGFYLVLRVSNVQSRHLATLIAKEDINTKESVKMQLEKYNTQDVAAQAHDYLDDDEPDEEATGIAYDSLVMARKDQSTSSAGARPSLLSHSISTVSLAALGKTSQTPNFVFKIKIMVGFFQIASILPSQGGIQWPKHFVDFITIFSFLNFDFMPWQSLGCVATINYFHKLLIVVCTPIAVLVLLLLFFYIPVLVKDESSIEDQLERQQKHARTTRQLVKLLLFTVFLLYPFVSKTVMGVFNCVEINGSWYLLTDLSLVCFNEEWTKYAYVAGFFVLAYPIGIPLVYFLLLRANRNELRQPATLYMLGFLYEAYTPKCFYWELLDMTHKLLLTSLVIFLPSIYELVASMVILIVYLEVLLWLQPYIRKGDDRFHQLVQIELYLFCLMGFMLTPPNPIDLDDATEILVSVLLIVLVVFLLSSFAIIAGRNVRKLVKQHRLARASAVGVLTVLPPPEPLTPFSEHRPQGSSAFFPASESPASSSASPL